MLVLLSLIVVSMAAPVVHALTLDGIMGKDSILGAIFYDVPAAIEAGSAMGIIAARILIGALVFVILFGGSQLLFKQYAQNIRVAIAGLVAAIAVFAIPQKMIQEIFFLWGGILYFIMVGVPIVLGTYFIFKKEGEKDRFYYFIRALIAAVLAYISSGLSDKFVTKVPILGTVIGGLITIFSFLFVGYILATIYFMFKWLWPGAADGESGVDEIPDKVKHKIGRWWRKRGRPEFGKVPQDINNIESELRVLKGLLANPRRIPGSDETSKNKILDLLDNAEKLKARIEKVEMYTAHVIQDTPAGPLKTKIEDLVAQIVAANKKIHGAFNKIRAEMKKPAPNVDSLLTTQVRDVKQYQRVVQSKETLLQEALKKA